MVRPARAFANRWAVAAVPFVVGLQLAAVYVEPLSRVLGTVPLAPGDWLAVAALSAVPAVVGQLLQAWQNREGAAAA